MEELLSTLERVSLTFGLKIKRSNIKIMIVDRINDNSLEVTQIENCEVLQAYVYLGAFVSNNSVLKQDSRNIMDGVPHLRIHTPGTRQYPVFTGRSTVAHTAVF